MCATLFKPAKVYAAKEKSNHKIVRKHHTTRLLLHLGVFWIVILPASPRSKHIEHYPQPRRRLPEGLSNHPHITDDVHRHANVRIDLGIVVRHLLSREAALLLTNGRLSGLGRAWSILCL